MSWSRRQVLTLSSGMVLAACGFQPLYGNRSASNSTPMQFAQIDVNNIDGRTGHHLRNYLIDRLSARGGHYKKAYRLDVALSETKDGLAIRSDEAVTRFNFRLLSNVRLTRIGDQQTLYESNLRVTAAYNVVESEFATLSAERDAEDRAARDMSSEIITRLAIYFQRHSSQFPA
jgi:LPS-assembly lipoprotein